jgi:hypothetical protein
MMHDDTPAPRARTTATNDRHTPKFHEWTLGRVHDDGVRDEVPVAGYLLGRATSEKDDHNHSQDFTPDGQRCSACRWFEVLIVDTSEDDEAGSTYLVYTCGRTIIPGERDRTRFVWTDSPREVVEALVVRQHGQPKLPVASARALAQAADLDDDIADAFDNRAVA